MFPSMVRSSPFLLWATPPQGAGSRTCPSWRPLSLLFPILKVVLQDASRQQIMFNWANAQSFPPIGADAPKPGEELRTTGSGRQERAIIKRDTFEAQIAGFFQMVATVSLTWILIHSIARQEKNNIFTVTLHVPLNWFGALNHDEYRSALVRATECLLDPSVGSIKRQPLIYQYFSTLLWKTVWFAETLPTCYYDSSYIDRLWQFGKSEGTVLVPSQAYPVRGPRWAFEVTNYDNNPTLLRVDIQAPKPYQFSCVVIIPLGSLAPRHRQCTLARRLRVIERIKAYIRALEEGNVTGQYAH